MSRNNFLLDKKFLKIMQKYIIEKSYKYYIIYNRNTKDIKNK